MTKRYLKVVYDVTGLSDEEVGALTLEAVVQAESSRAEGDSPGHPSVEVETYVFDDDLKGVHGSAVDEVRRYEMQPGRSD